MDLIPDGTEWAAGTYAQSWTVVSTPELAGLLGQKVVGTWTLTVTDTTDDGGPGTIVGQVEEFEIVYDVVRSDQIQVAGRLDVEGDLNVGGDVIVGDKLYRKVFAHTGLANQTCNETYCTTREFTVPKEHDDTTLFITWSDNFRCNGGNGSCHWYLRFSGPGFTNAACTDPYDLGYHLHDGTYNHHQPHTAYFFCKKIAGQPIPAGDITVKVLESGETGDSVLGWESGQFLFLVEEVY
jgi:hypothetical protein